jgi:uncharacterized protein (TIGR02099 family)
MLNRTPAGSPDPADVTRSAPGGQRRILDAFPRRVWEVGGWILATLFFAAAALILGLRYLVLPEIDNHRGELEQVVSQSIGLKVTIREIAADWQGLNPRLALQGVRIADEAGRPALEFQAIEAVLSWTTLLYRALRLERLELLEPMLTIRRAEDGSLFVAGIRVDPDAERADLSDWILWQRQVVIRDATLIWEDALRRAPPLELKRVNLRLDNSGKHHRFGVTAEPPPALASGLDVRGDLEGRTLDRLEDWHGELYAVLGHVDLSAWRTWVDYPADLSQGGGALRMWVDVAGGRVESATADLDLRAVRIRLRADLPQLELTSLDGRLTLARSSEGFRLVAERLALATRDEMRIGPLDLSLNWAAPRGPEGQGSGELTANGLDLGALARLASYLPLNDPVRSRLNEYRPQGKAYHVELKWTERAGEFEVLAVRARFENLGLQPSASLPGFSGLSGELSGSQEHGSISLDSRHAALVMPEVFPEPRLDFEKLQGQAAWSTSGAERELRLDHAAFANRDAAGTASGHYTWRHGELGEIDLVARLSRAETSAVWRYLPAVVMPDVRAWLKAGLVGGRSDEAKLRLKGNLHDFPFSDPKQGIFQVTGRFSGATLRYAPDWPPIENLAGELLFEGRKMVIQASSGKLYGAQIVGARAEIPDLGAASPMLRVHGRASGPTGDFLRFVAASPVSGFIDHFTDDVRAGGSGTLQLTIDMPLARIDKTRIQGEFGIVDNTVYPVPGLPPLTNANARVVFSESALTVRNATARLLDSPLTVSAETRDGAVAFNLSGSASVAGLRQHFDLPLLDHLSGSAAWRGGLRVQKGQMRLDLESNLVGIASSLPAPFNKTATEPLPLKFERSANPLSGNSARQRELTRIGLGQILNATLQRRLDGGAGTLERGAIGIAQSPPAMPERGLALAGQLESLDVDAWQRAVRAGVEGGGIPLASISAQVGELTAFGQRFKDFGVKAIQRDGVWRAQVSSRELNGDLSWGRGGAGKLQARLKNLMLAEVRPEAVTPSAEEEVKELPALDIVAESFSLRGKQLGRLELEAVNRAGIWDVDRLLVRNQDGTLTATGEWQAGAASGHTVLDFQLNVGDIGKLLERLGYPNAVRRGTGKLEGKVGWDGAPSGIDYASLGGTLNLDVRQGQFAKLEPGMGRLLGVLSLQALPRRITLDFRDLFSEGFAFDSISGSIDLRRGVMETRNLAIAGPAAKVLMSGAVNLNSETQDLVVKVQPTLSETVAIGAAIVNPLAGVAALVAQKVLKDPIEQAFSYQYRVTGGWSDPKVEPLARPQVAQPAGNSP